MLNKKRKYDLVNPPPPLAETAVNQLPPRDDDDDGKSQIGPYLISMENGNLVIETATENDGEIHLINYRDCHPINPMPVKIYPAETIPEQKGK